MLPVYSQPHCARYGSSPERLAPTHLAKSEDRVAHWLRRPSESCRRPRNAGEDVRQHLRERAIPRSDWLLGNKDDVSRMHLEHGCQSQIGRIVGVQMEREEASGFFRV